MTETGREKDDLIRDEDPAACPDGVSDHADAALNPVADQHEEQRPGFLELIYGVLFEPVDTFRRIAPEPPILLTLFIVTFVNLATSLMGVLTYRSIAPRGFTEWEAMLTVLLPFLTLIGFFWWYLKWLGYGAVLHLVAQLLGGANGPKATLAVYGLASLPGLFLLPVEALIIIAGLGETASARLMAPAGLGVWVWSLVLLVIGLREVHGFTTGRAVGVVALPVAAVVVLVFVTVVILGIGLSASLARFSVPF